MSTAPRIHSIDRVRGLVMIIMALDHVRDLLHTTSLTQDPTDLQTTTPILFFTRWITYLCAPAFVFLSGASAYIAYQNRKDHTASKRLLLQRGLWLILLELVFVNFVLWFDVHFRIIFLQVIAAIGFGFILLSFMLKIKAKWLALIAIIIIAIHQLLATALISGNNYLDVITGILFRRSVFVPTPGFMFLVAYPWIPWFGIMLLGFSLGSWFTTNAATRRKNLLLAGFTALVIFFVFRIVNGYGDPAQWSGQKNSMYTMLSFINVSKYPPSLIYIALFTGITLVLLCLFERGRSWLMEVLSVYGKVPMFYYILHLVFIRIALFVMVFAQGYSMNDLSFAPFQFGRAPGSGINLTGVYVVWLVIVVLLYPLCKWYAGYKANHREKWWLSYV